MSLCLSVLWAFQALHVVILSHCCTELTVTSRSKDSKSGRRASHILTPNILSSRGESAQGFGTFATGRGNQHKQVALES